MTKKLPKELLEDLEMRLGAYDRSCKEAGLGQVDETIRPEVMRVFAFSRFIAQSAAAHPKMVDELIKSGDLYREYAVDEHVTSLRRSIRDMKDEQALGKALRGYRNREMVRIAWRDLVGRADLFQTMKELSAFAEACVDETFSLLHQWHCKEFGTPTNSDGTPQKIVVIAMGKLGAEELNFSSDIDLMFAYPEAGETIGLENSLTHEEFFTGLSRRFLRVFSDAGIGGLLFRVDLRLRPFGENGPLIMSFNAMEDYYQTQGREWERYALIKARIIAGDRKAGDMLLERLTPFIYRRYLDYGVYESIREMKKKIALEIERKRLTENIKLGQGGIREVEFFGQIFQLIRGGVEPGLRQRPILKVLTSLVAEGYIPDHVCNELSSAYQFLRKTENRLQEYDDQQTHDLPRNPLERISLAASMGFGDWESFEEELRRHMNNVHLHFNELLVGTDEVGGENDRDALDAVWKGLSEKEVSEEVLGGAGYENPSDINLILETMRNDAEMGMLSSEGRDRLDKLMPLLLEKVGLVDQPDQILKRILDLIKAIEKRTCYISLLLENPDALTQLVTLAGASPWIISFLSRYPLLLDELLDSRRLYTPPTREELTESLLIRLERVPKSDLELQMEELNIFKHANILHVAAADVAGAFRLMKVSDYLSELAETVLEKVLELSWEHLVEKYGRPLCYMAHKRCEKGFVVVALGKLGGLELGYGSDLDLVFLHAGKPGPTDGSDDSIETPQFYARLGQRIIHLLTTHTAVGKLYDIDMRLRPSGHSGTLVSNIEAYADYMREEAWTWEHQALVRGRAVCGDNALVERFETIRKEVLCRPRDKKTLAEEILSMRDRMRRESRSPKSGDFDIKQGRGGIIDIEFLIQYFILLHAVNYPELVRWSDNVRQIETLADAEIIDPSTARLLKEVYLALRKEVHRLNLQQKPLIIPVENISHLTDKTARIWDQYL
ncbi:MAG: bifunctional [glutamate--ammonia ligase]-adenylyl-L-tyrosine phosphorylase/[glutamate--ammonia-ligase] adenylyltransferase [Thermodesulfobacteriota bacterium]|nr:bifunctional [glutamate--ammonia ligase]-adenylyl-L-tyrosine phosphorylase/[glutamate--ammonia-ligase] adenylyltransferase [Thermodesulfobacteriota bacterium]